MTEPLNLDDRTFEDLKREMLLRIPRYTPEWTDFNESDPGVTLIELFAWLTELTLYRLNQVPEQSYRKFLELVGLRPRPAEPATAYLTFTAAAGADVPTVPAGTPVEAEGPGGGPPVVFETTGDLDLVRVPLTDLQVYDGTFTPVTPANDDAGATYRPLGWQPRPGNALYLGFTPAEPPGPAPFPAMMHLRVFLSAQAQAGRPQRADDTAGTPPAPPVVLVWEYRSRSAPDRWQRLDVFADDTAAFTREGFVRLAGPADPVATEEGRVGPKRYWLRVRLASGGYPADRAPEIDFLRPNVVTAVNRVTAADEVLGVGDGRPGQAYRLAGAPVDADSLRVRTDTPGGDREEWTRVDDLLASGPDDRHVVLTAGTGEVRFGDGARGRIPPAGALVVASAYRYGGGAAGNLPAGRITSPATALTGVEGVTNERPAVGGSDEQSLDDLRATAPHRLAARDRAVTARDFVALAEEVGGVLRATALPLAHPAHPGVAVAGAVTVVVVPDTGEQPPRPSADLLRAVAGRLNRYRLVTTELHVAGPRYRPVTVTARIVGQPYASPDRIRRQVAEAIDAYLSPAVRPFGLDLTPTNLYNVILDVADVLQVRSLSVAVDGVPVPEISVPVELGADEMVYGTGAHTIVVEPSRDR